LIVAARDGSLAGAATWSGDVSSNTKFNLEKSLAELEALVDELETGDLPLEKAMKKFEDGIKLTRGCQAALKEAEQKVEVLLQSAGGEKLEEFDAGED
jgi:exodeoxyribonuclease VII small subunit